MCTAAAAAAVKGARVCVSCVCAHTRCRLLAGWVVGSQADNKRQKDGRQFGTILTLRQQNQVRDSFVAYLQVGDHDCDAAQSFL